MSFVKVSFILWLSFNSLDCIFYSKIDFNFDILFFIIIIIYTSNYYNYYLWICFGIVSRKKYQTKVIQIFLLWFIVEVISFMVLHFTFICIFWRDVTGKEYYFAKLRFSAACQVMIFKRADCYFFEWVINVSALYWSWKTFLVASKLWGGTSKIAHIAINSMIPIDLNSLQHPKNTGSCTNRAWIYSVPFFPSALFFSCEEIS